MYSQTKIDRLIAAKTIEVEVYANQIKDMEEKIVVLETANKELESKLTAVETKVEAIDVKPVVTK